MGKSYVAKAVLSPIYGAVYRKIDEIYSTAVTEAGMVTSGTDANPAGGRRMTVKDARRYARDRKWPSPEARVAFFRSFERQVREALAEGLARRALVVLEGGSLRHEDETEAVVRCVREVCGPMSRIVRATVVVPYPRWLQNRVNRMVTSKVETAKVGSLSLEAYEREVKQAQPKPSRLVPDRTLGSTEDIIAMMTELGFSR